MLNFQKIKTLAILRHARRVNKWVVMGGFAVIVSVMVVTILVLSRTGVNSISYKENLDNLIKSITALSENLEVPEKNNTESNLEAYQMRLDELDKQCSELIRHKGPDNSKEGKAVGERISGICEDLIPVAYYSRQLHEQIHDYILLSDEEWPKPGTTEFDNRLESTVRIISETKRNLEALNNRKVQDPALSELIYQVKIAEETAKKVQSTNNPEESSKQAEELRSLLARDRTDFLAARTYFWNNTIGIAQLHKSLSDVRAALSLNKADRPD